MKQLKRYRLACIPLLFLVLGAGMLVVFYTEITSQSKKLASINLAGRQRTLSQKHMLGVLLTAKGNESDYQKIRKLLLESLQFLRQGGKHEFGTIEPAKEEPLLLAIDQQEIKLVDAFEIADQYLDRTRQASQKISQLREQLTELTEQTHSTAHQIVLMESKLDANGPTVNLAGRQRSLIQRHSKEILNVAFGGTADYQKTRQLLMHSLDRLGKGGDHEFGFIDSPASAELTRKVTTQRAQFEETFATADRLLDFRSQSESLLRELRSKLEASTREAHDSAHHVVVMINESGTRSRARGTLIAIVVGLVLSAFGCTVALLIIKSMVREIAKTASEIGNLTERELAEVSVRMQRSAASTSDRANSSNAAASELDTEAQSLVSAVEQFESSIESIVDNSTEASEIVSQAVTIAEDTTKTITELEKGASSIREVVQTINSVAEQTNLLALNATIEAARAGHAGKGFAVVANEVKELAKQTQLATHNIEQQISANIASTENAISAISSVSKIIFQIKARQSGISTSVHEQSQVTAGLSSSISNVARGTAIIAEDLSSIASDAEATSEASERNRNAAQQIGDLANELRQFVGKAQASSTTIA